MTGRESLDAAYFEGVFHGDDDPWNLASSPYEAAKFDHTCAVLADRRYGHALEVGCAHGVLTERLAPMCKDFLAVDISARALELARARLADLPRVRFAEMAFPRQTPDERDLDLVVWSEVVYYWSDEDLGRAARWACGAMVGGARLLLVHYTGQTDYPQTGDQAVAGLWRRLSDAFVETRAERRESYRLDLWTKR